TLVGDRLVAPVVRSAQHLATGDRETKRTQRRLIAGTRQDRLAHLGLGLEVLPDQGLFFAAEVVEERPGGDVRDLADRLDGEALQPFLERKVQRCLLYVPAGGQLLAFTEAET